MRHLILFVASLLIITSCDQNNTTEKQEDVSEKNADSTANTADDEATTASLNISTLDEEGDMGRTTFSQNEKTIFYYDLTTKEGKIKLNDAEYTLDKYNANSGSYTLSGKDVTINAPNGKYKVNEGSDCEYGDFTEVTVTLGKAVLKLNNVKVQDCPDYQ